MNFNTEHFDALKTLRFNQSRPYNLVISVLWYSLVHSSATQQVVEI